MKPVSIFKAGTIVAVGKAAARRTRPLGRVEDSMRDHAPDRVTAHGVESRGAAGAGPAHGAPAANDTAAHAENHEAQMTGAANAPEGRNPMPQDAPKMTLDQLLAAVEAGQVQLDPAVLDALRRLQSASGGAAPDPQAASKAMLRCSLDGIRDEITRLKRWGTLDNDVAKALEGLHMTFEAVEHATVATFQLPSYRMSGAQQAEEFGASGGTLRVSASVTATGGTPDQPPQPTATDPRANVGKSAAALMPVGVDLAALNAQAQAEAKAAAAGPGTRLVAHPQPVAKVARPTINPFDGVTDLAPPLAGSARAKVAGVTKGSGTSLDALTPTRAEIAHEADLAAHLPAGVDLAVDVERRRRVDTLADALFERLQKKGSR